LAEEPADVSSEPDVRLAEQQEIERRLQEVQARFETAFRSAPIGMALIDMAGQWLQVNDSLCRITGFSGDELRAMTLGEVTHPDDLASDADELQKLLHGQIENYHVEQRYRHAWGHYNWVLVTVSLVRDDRGRPLYLISQVQDIAERKELEAHLEHLVHHDFLTGLFNRRHFEEELRLHVRRVARYGATGALLLIDLDNFKDVNDSFGHKAGDDLLKGVASSLRQRARATDVLARLGGDEFGLLVTRANAREAEAVAADLVKVLSRHVAVLSDERIRISASIGVALFDGLSDVEVLAYADLAMYEAKEAGRNRFSLYNPSGDRRARATARLTEAERIHQALEQDEFTLYCQPIVDLTADAGARYELLLRLQPIGREEPLLPSEFLYAAERFGLIQAIDAWVVRQAVALLTTHVRAGRQLTLDVNLSGKTIGDPQLGSLIESLLTESGIDPSCLVFEVTETALIADIEHARRFADRLRSLGCQLALDDFGAGFGSFFYLKNLPFDYLKIDGDYIRDLADNPMDRLLVEALVTIAQGMGKKTIAEFVPSETVKRLLRTIGVDYGQGFHIGQPRPVSDVLAVPSP
jgi:diguanylate cyclase (GGDEF)-like protein/PAS domain S-box-containing protein